MANEIELLIDMLPWLVANNGCSLGELATHFEVTEKQAIALLAQLVVTGPSQAGGGLVDIDFEDQDSIYVLDAKSLDRPVKLSSLEAVSLLGGLHYLEQFENIADPAIVSGLINKIQNLFPETTSPITVIPSPIVEQVSSAIRNALETGNVLSIRYAAVSKDEVSDRVVDPLEIYSQDDNSYLRAWCRASKAWRNFRLDRIIGAEVLPDKRNIPESTDAGEPSREYVVTIEMDKAYYGQLDQVEIISAKESMWHAVEVQMRVFSKEWVISMILASGGRIRATGPSDLIEGLIERAKAWE